MVCIHACETLAIRVFKQFHFVCIFEVKNLFEKSRNYLTTILTNFFVQKLCAHAQYSNYQELFASHELIRLVGTLYADTVLIKVILGE